MHGLNEFAKKILPSRFVHWYRRRRASRRFMRALGYEVFDRQQRMDLEDVEGRAIAKRQGLQEQIVKDVLSRTDLVLQELHRRIEGVSTRQAEELRALAAEVEAIKRQIETLMDVARTSPLVDTEQ